eukprot:2787432-Alexandrium_andersonii.AAC.1
MSASLVGSEMCIRDRRGHGLGTQFPEEEHGRLEDVPALDPRFHVGPVSYTHLTLPTICSV